MPTLKPPAGLGAKSRKLWTEITTQFELRTDELRTLEDACREVDIIEALERDLSGADLTAKGSQGQPVANPLLSEVRQHRSMLIRLFQALHLPEEADSAASRSTAGRNLVNARWGRRGA